MNDSLFSRERLAGYDPERLSRAVVTIVGCGAGGTNVAQSLALIGVGELRFIDPDVVERSNLPRSPLFDASRVNGKRRRYKANECALRALEISHADSPVVRFAANRVEELGAGAFLGSDVILAAADSFAVRARLSDGARLLGIPLVELGFAGDRGHVSVWPGSAYGSDACWRCSHPLVEHGGVGCGLYARRAAGEGLIAATQPLAGTIGNLAAFHVLEALHERFPLGGRIAHLDLHRGTSRVVEVTCDPSCPGVHRTLAEIRELPVPHNGTVEQLMKAVRAFAKEPVLYLPDPYIKEAPCQKCGAPVPVGRPAWAVTEAPECRSCSEVPQLGAAGIVAISSIEPDDEFSTCRLGQFGLGPGAVLEVTDRATGARHGVRIGGGLEGLYMTLRREKRNERRAGGKGTSGATDAPNQETDNGKTTTAADQSDIPPSAGFARVHRRDRLGDDGPGGA